MSMLRSRRKSWKQTLELVQKRLECIPRKKVSLVAYVFFSTNLCWWNFASATQEGCCSW